MSAKVVGLVLDSQVKMDPTTKLVLVSFAEHAHPDGTHAFPSVQRIARYCCIDRRTAQRHIAKLKDRGLLVEVTPAAGTKPAEYRVVLEALDVGAADCRPMAQVAQGGGTDATPGGGAGGTGGAAPMPPEPSTEPTSTATVSNQPLGAHARESEAQQAQLLTVDAVATVRRQRQPDPLWDAVMHVCGVDTSAIPESARGKYGRVVKELKAIGATPDDVLVRAASYKMRYPGTITPNALLMHWSECTPDHVMAEAGERNAVRNFRDPVSASVRDLMAEAEMLRQQEARELAEREERMERYSLGS